MKGEVRGHKKKGSLRASEISFVWVCLYSDRLNGTIRLLFLHFAVRVSKTHCSMWGQKTL